MNQFESEYRRNSSSFLRKNSADMVEEITLEKISNLEDEYSKMKKALLSSMESDDDYINSDDEGFPNANSSREESKLHDSKESVEKALECRPANSEQNTLKNLFGAPKSTTKPSNINSRSFLDDSNNHKDFSKTHGKLSTVDDFVDSELKLGNYSPLGVDLKHEDVLDRPTGPSQTGKDTFKVYTIPEEDEEISASGGVAYKKKGRIVSFKHEYGYQEIL